MNWALEQRHLKPGPWIVLIQLADRHNKDTKLCRPEQALLAHDCNISRATLNRHLSEIENEGLIQRVERMHPVTKKQLATQYILAIDYDDPPDVDFAASQNETRDFEGQSENTADTRVSNLDTETVSQNSAIPCLKNRDSRVSNRDTSNPVREPIKEPSARGAREAGFQPENDRGPEKPVVGEIDVVEAFSEFWAAYPRQEEETAARRAWRKVAKAQAVAAILAGARAYNDDDRVKRGFAKLPANWLLDRCWETAKGPAAPRVIDLDGLAALWAPKITGGGFVPPSAISPVLARHMLQAGMVSLADLDRIGVRA